MKSIKTGIMKNIELIAMISLVVVLASVIIYNIAVHGI